MASVLIVDDEITMCEVLGLSVERLGHTVTSVHTLTKALDEVSANDYDVVFLDVTLPDGNGLDVLPQIRDRPSPPEVIIITGLGRPDGAELAIRSGAWDYIVKGDTILQMTLPLTRALQYRHEKLARNPIQELKRENLIGESARFRSVLDLVRLASNGETNVLLTGETGSGKEKIARTIHQNSSRSEKNFVVVDCAALPETLLESTLFGHEKGAFTGADQKREGVFLQADGGTLFLDEVGELPFTLQRRFLRVLQERCFRPVGGDQMVHSNFRLISATHRNLQQMVCAETFREDLLFRLRTSFIEIPPLRERMDDIRPLVEHYAIELCERYEVGQKSIDKGFLEVLEKHDWPGNVRELLNAVEVAFFAAQQDATLFEKHLPSELRAVIASSWVARRMRVPALETDAKMPSIDDEDLPNLKALVAGVEEQYLRKLLVTTNGNIQEACKKAGVSRTQFYRLLDKHAIGR